MRPFTLLAMFTVLAGSCTTAGAQAIGHGGPIRLAAPPPGFRPDTASDGERAAYGLPTRPSPLEAHGVPYIAWSRAMSHAGHYIAPQFRLDRHVHGPAIMRASPAATTPRPGEAVASNSSNWAGQLLDNFATGFGAGSFSEIFAQWVNSAVQQAVGTCTTTPSMSATWVGIDGFGGSTDVMQAGTEADASCYAGITSQNDYVWYEWYPAGGYELTNFPIHPGGSIFVVLQTNSATSATVTYVNLQNNDYTVVGFNAPAGTALHGNTAEWIVERPSPGTNQPLGALADFGQVPMNSEIAYLLSQRNTSTYETPGTPPAGETGYTLTMTNNAGTVLANSADQGPPDQIITVQGPTEY